MAEAARPTPDGERAGSTAPTEKSRSGRSARPTAAPGASGAESARPSLPASLAASARWAGERGRGRGWEDYLAEFLAALLVWGGIGYLLDRWLGTEPWLLIAGLVLGNGLGIYLLWLRSNENLSPEQRAAEARMKERVRAARTRELDERRRRKARDRAARAGERTRGEEHTGGEGRL